MKRIGKYLRWDDDLGEIVNNNGDVMGVVEYRNGWRQFTFDPHSNWSFNHRCLTDIAAHLVEMNKTKGAYKVKS